MERSARPHRQHRHRRGGSISQTQIDFLCLATFGQRGLPDAMAERIALRREFARGIADALDRAELARTRASLPAAALEAFLAAAG